MYQGEPAPGQLPTETNEACAGLCSSYLQEQLLWVISEAKRSNITSSDVLGLNVDEKTCGDVGKAW